jgi:hypothetical protein
VVGDELGAVIEQHDVNIRRVIPIVNVQEAIPRAGARPSCQPIDGQLVALMDLMTTVGRSRVACLAAADLHRRVRAPCEASMRLRQMAVGLRRRVRFAIGGGCDNRDIPVSESAIRAQLRRLVEGGILPRGAPKAVGAGRSQG